MLISLLGIEVTVLSGQLNVLLWNPRTISRLKIRILESLVSGIYTNMMVRDVRKIRQIEKAIGMNQGHQNLEV